MRARGFLGRAFGAAVLLASPLLLPAAARGETIQLLIGFSPGGGYDLYARTVARHLGRHLPGNPTIVPQNMPGAGSLKLVNYLYGVARKDGTTIGAFAPGVVMQPLLGHAEGAEFKAADIGWLGSVSQEVSVCAFMSSAGIKTWQDMRSKPYVIGASGAGAESDVFPTVLKNMFHLPLKLVTGFTGGSEVTLAMERHEVDGRCGWSWTSLVSRSRALLDTHAIDVTLQIALARHADLPGVPLLMEMAETPTQQAALKLIISRQNMARPFAAPPGVPAARLAALRAGFDATMQDADFLAEAKRQDLDVSPLSGAEVARLIDEAYAAPPEVVKLATDALREVH